MAPKSKVRKMPEKGVNNRFKQVGNNLLIKFPLIAMEFYTKKNCITPDKVYPYSNKTCEIRKAQRSRRIVPLTFV